MSFTRAINTAGFKSEQTNRNSTSIEQYVTVSFLPRIPGYGLKKKPNQITNPASEGWVILCLFLNIHSIRNMPVLPSSQTPGLHKKPNQNKTPPKVHTCMLQNLLWKTSPAKKTLARFTDIRCCQIIRKTETMSQILKSFCENTSNFTFS